MLFAVSDEHAMAQQVRDGVMVAPQQLVPFGNQHFAVGFGTEDYIRFEARQRDLEEAPNVFRQDLQWS